MIIIIMLFITTMKIIKMINMDNRNNSKNIFLNLPKSKNLVFSYYCRDKHNDKKVRGRFLMIMILKAARTPL